VEMSATRPEVAGLTPVDKVSRVGLGGFHISKLNDPDEAVELVRYAIASGITFMDNSWDYNEGESERRMGMALGSGGYRDKVFLMTKVDSRSYDGLMRQVEESLSRLQTGYLDLLQLHEVIHEDDPERAAEKGALAALQRLRDEAVVHHIGITGHKDPAIHEAFIKRASAEGVEIESAQFPVNVFDLSFRSFVRELLPYVRERGIAPLGMKPLGAGDLVTKGGMNAEALLTWAMAQSTAVCITGCQSTGEVDQAVRVWQRMPDVTQQLLDDIEQRAAALAGDMGRFESYKVTQVHDGTSANPSWLE
jgi:diketogulonate reductase-like aldo/keto reductase